MIGGIFGVGLSLRKHPDILQSIGEDDIQGFGKSFSEKDDELLCGKRKIYTLID